MTVAAGMPLRRRISLSRVTLDFRALFSHKPKITHQPASHSAQSKVRSTAFFHWA
jgi:hypothetical protein